MLGKLASSGLASRALNASKSFASSGIADQLKNAAMSRAENAISTLGTSSPGVVAPTALAGAPADMPTVEDTPSPITLQQAEVVKTLVEAGMPLKEAMVAATGVVPEEAPSGPSIADAIAQVAAQRGARRKTRRLRKQRKTRRGKAKRTKTSRS